MNQTTTDFTKRLDDLTRGFVGRGWLIDEVDAFISQAAYRYMVVVGEAGIGKSAFAARLIQLGKANAYHFCVAREGGSLEPVAFARSLGVQLARTLPGFGEQLVNQTPMKKIDVTQEIKELKGGTVYGVYIEKFIVQGPSAQEAFQLLVREPLQLWANSQPGSTRVVLIVDALDEATRLDRHPNIADLVNETRDLPDQVRWVLTSRPDGAASFSEMLPGRQQLVLERSEGNLNDVGEYVDAALAEPAIAVGLQTAAMDPATLRNELLTRSSGNFLYLKYVLQGLREDIAAGRPPPPVDRLPMGLDAVYSEFLDRVLASKAKNDWRRIYRPVLGVLAVAQEALAFEQLVALSGVNEQATNDVVEDLRQLLDVPQAGQTGAFRIYHTSFADFLTDRTRNPAYWTDPIYYHRQIAENLLERFDGVWAKTRPKDALAAYAFRHVTAHLARVAVQCREAGRLAEQHTASEKLVRLALAEDFQDAHEAKIGDLQGLHQIVVDAMRQAAEDDDPEGLPLAVEAATGLVAFRRRRLTPGKVFTHARTGDVRGAEVKLDLFATEQDWRQAALLQIAWLAAPLASETAGSLHARVVASPNLVPPVAVLAQRVGSVLAGQPLPQTSLADIPQERVRALLERLGSMKSKIGLPAEGAWESMHIGPEENSYAASIRLSDADSLDLVAYMANHPEEQNDYVRDELRILASNSYAQYRNRFLWPLLFAVLQHPDPVWTQGMITDIMIAALTGSPLEFTEGLPTALLACRTATDIQARARLDSIRRAAFAAAQPFVSEESGGDSWGSHTRRLAVLAEIYHVLRQHGTAGAGQAVTELLALAGRLHFGFAGFQTPAWLTLAETIRVCGGSSQEVRQVLDKAADSAHNVQDPTFCARTTARYNALRELWWGAAPTGYDSLAIAAALNPAEFVLRHQADPSGFDVSAAVEAFRIEPSRPPFTALHRVGETYEGRGFRGNFAPTPDWASNATTLSALARLYGFSEAEFRRLNPKVSADTPLDPSQVPLICVPDPEFPPLLAARMAAEVLSVVSDRDERIRLIQQLVPIAAANPTALDVVLARLMLAAFPIPPSILIQLGDTIVSALPEPAAGGQVGPMIGSASVDFRQGKLSVLGAGDETGSIEVITGVTIDGL